MCASCFDHKAREHSSAHPTASLSDVLLLSHAVLSGIDTQERAVAIRSWTAAAFY